MWKDARKELIKDKYIGPLIEKFGPCKLITQPKSMYFERLVRSISGQQLSTKAAATIFGRVKERLGGVVVADNVLELGDGELRECGLSNAKVSYVYDLAEKVNNNDLEISKLDRLPNNLVLEELTLVKGIGQWTAEMFMMFTLARPDIFPIDDLGIRKGMMKLLDRKMSKDEMVRFAFRWKPYRTYASYYIWENLDNT